MTAPPMNRSQQGGLQKACHLPEESGPRGGFSLYKAAQVPAQVTQLPPLLPQLCRCPCLWLGFSSCPHNAHLGDTWLLQATLPLSWLRWLRFYWEAMGKQRRNKGNDTKNPRR